MERLFGLESVPLDRLYGAGGLSIIFGIGILMLGCEKWIGDMLKPEMKKNKEFMRIAILIVLFPVTFILFGIRELISPRTIIINLVCAFCPIIIYEVMVRIQTRFEKKNGILEIMDSREKILSILLLFLTVLVWQDVKWMSNLSKSLSLDEQTFRSHVFYVFGMITGAYTYTLCTLLSIIIAKKQQKNKPATEFKDSIQESKSNSGGDGK